MDLVDQIIKREEKKKQIFAKASAGLQADLAALNSISISSLETEPLSPRAEEELKKIEKEGEGTKEYAENLDVRDDKFESNWLGISLLHFPADTKGMTEAEISSIGNRIKEFNDVVKKILEDKKEQRDAYLETLIDRNNLGEGSFIVSGVDRASMGGSGTLGIEPRDTTTPAEPEVEVVIPEVVPGINIPRAQEAKTETPEEIMDPIDIEVIETGLIPARDASEKDRRLIALSQKLDDARKFYVEQDREMDKGSSIWKKITGFGRRSGLGETEKAFNESDARYNNALRDYKDAILATEVKDEEDIKIVTEWLTMKERVILDGERTNQSTKDKGLSQKVLEYYVSGINKYRKLPWKQRVAIGAGISAVGFGAGMIGGMVGGAAIGAAGISRIISFSASTIGSKEALEGWDKRKREKRGEEESKTIIKNSHIEGAGRWEQGLWNQNLNDKIAKLDEEIQKNKFHGKLRTWGAVGSGIALSFISRWVGREAMEHLHIKELAQNIGGKLGFSSGVVAGKVSEVAKPFSSPHEIGSQKSVMGIGYHPETSVKVEISDDGFKTLQEQTAKVNLVTGSPVTGADSIAEVAGGMDAGSVEFTVGETKANSFEGIIREHLDKNPDLVEKYNQLDPKGRTFDAGQIATRMADDYAKTHNLEKGPFSLVHEGFKVQFDPEHMKITGVSGDDKMGWLADEKNPTKIFEKTEVPGARAEIVAPSAENVAGLDYEKLVEHPAAFPNVSENVSFDPSLESSGVESAVASAVESEDFLDQHAGTLLEKVNTDLAEWQSIPRVGRDLRKYIDLGDSFAKSLVKLIGGNRFENWTAVKHLSAREVLNEDGEGSKRMRALLERLLKAKLPEEADTEAIKHFQKMVRPRGEERVYNWVKRVVLLVKHSGVKKI